MIEPFQTHSPRLLNRSFGASDVYPSAWRLKSEQIFNGADRTVNAEINTLVTKNRLTPRRL